MTEIKKIGILTSGGDCAGLNAVVMSVVNSAAQLGWEVYGIHNGTDGVTETPLSYELLTERNFSDTPWPRLAGSYLGSLNKGVKMESQAEISARFGKGVAELGLDAVIVVGYIDQRHVFTILLSCQRLFHQLQVAINSLILLTIVVLGATACALSLLLDEILINVSNLLDLS